MQSQISNRICFDDFCSIRNGHGYGLERKYSNYFVYCCLIVLVLFSNNGVGGGDIRYKLDHCFTRYPQSIRFILFCFVCYIRSNLTILLSLILFRLFSSFFFQKKRDQNSTEKKVKKTINDCPAKRERERAETKGKNPIGLVRC